MDIRPEAAQACGTNQYEIQQAGPQGPSTPLIVLCPNTEDC
jgi:hypothetical protein